MDIGFSEGDFVAVERDGDGVPGGVGERVGVVTSRVEVGMGVAVGVGVGAVDDGVGPVFKVGVTAGVGVKV